MPKTEKAEPNNSEAKPDVKPADAKASAETRPEDTRSEPAPEERPLNRSEVGKLGAKARWDKERDKKMAAEEEPEIPKRELRAKETGSEQKDERGKKETDWGGLALGLALGAVVIVLLLWMLRNRKKRPGSIDTTAKKVEEETTPEVPARLGARSMLEIAEEESPWGSVLR